MAVVLRREDFADTGDYLEALDEAERQDLEMYRKINPKLGRPWARTPEAEPHAPTNNDEEDEDEDNDYDDEYSASDSEQVGTMRKRRRRAPCPGPVTRKIARRKSIPPACNAESVLVPVRWSLRSRNRDPSTPPQATQPGKALYDTPVPSEDEEDVDDGPEVMIGTAGRRNASSAWSGSRPCPTLDAIVTGADSDVKDVDSSDGDEYLFPLAAPPSLLHLIRRSPSPSFAPSVGVSPFSSRSSLSPPPPSPRSTSPRASTPPPDAPHCGNCLSTTSSDRWRRSKLELETRLCSACSKYERRHHCHRPSALNQRRKMQRFPPSASPERCGNCQSTFTIGGWRRSMLEPETRLCKACYHYERSYHRHRPLALDGRWTDIVS
ncbi:hypothetical protein C8R43DRAFT_1201330 [Mycena crocata]|nr:hypothetical protein C8R43DRAFT_1201330 [Mycena crocata]